MVFTQGIGFLLSSQILVGWVYPKVMGPDGGGAAEWGRFWLVPAGYMMVVLVIFWFFFRDDREKAVIEEH